MKNRKLVTVFITLCLSVSLIGCGNKTNDENTEVAENIEKEVMDTQVVEATEEEVIVPTSTYDGLTFIEPSGNGDYCFDVSKFDKDMDVSFEAPKDLDIYSDEGIKIAEVKKGVTLHVIKASSMYSWYELENPVKNTPYDKLYLLEDDDIDVAMVSNPEDASKTEETETNGSNTTKETVKKDTSTKKETASSTTNSNTSNEEQTVNDQPVIEEQPEQPTTSNKYTPEEAVAYYRSQIEAQGMQWDPSIKEGASWGTGWIPLNKDELNASYISNAMEGYDYGSGDGTPMRKYYIEVTGSDENYVYITEWVS